MSKRTRSRIPEGLIDRVIHSVLCEVKHSEAVVDEVDLLRLKQRDGLVLRAILNYLDENNTNDSSNNNNNNNNNSNNNNSEQDLSEESVAKMASSIVSTLKWRASYKINSTRAEDFPSAFRVCNPFVACVKHHNGDTVILVQDNSKHEKISNEWNCLIERYWIYFTEQVTSQYFNQGKDVLYLMDFTNFGCKNLDSSLCLSFYDIIGKHYPRITLENNAIDMPWYAKPVMKLVLKILPASISSNFKTISRKELASRLGDQCLPESLGGENKCYQPLASASRFVSIQEIGEKNGIPQEDIDRMMKHLGEK